MKDVIVDFDIDFIYILPGFIMSHVIFGPVVHQKRLYVEQLLNFKREFLKTLTHVFHKKTTFVILNKLPCYLVMVLIPDSCSATVRNSIITMDVIEWNNWKQRECLFLFISDNSTVVLNFLILHDKQNVCTYLWKKCSSCEIRQQCSLFYLVPKSFTNKSLYFQTMYT
jgi:hypothetical protein